jgi:hypothetical protein
MRDPIIITGCARSGTSIIAGAINLCGAFGGIMFGPNQNNQKGMFENTRIRGELIKPYLKQLGADPMCQYPLPDPERITIPVDWRSKVQQIMVDQGYKDGPWMIKEPKIGVHWQVWHHAFPDAKWVIVRRRTGDIVNSCMKTNFMRAFSRPENQRAVGVKDEREGWIWWVNQHVERFVEMHVTDEDGPNCKVIWPHRFVNRDYKPLHELMEWLGLEVSDKEAWKKIFDFVDPRLWHSRQAERPPEVEEKLEREINELINTPNHGNISNG